MGVQTETTIIDISVVTLRYSILNIRHIHTQHEAIASACQSFHGFSIHLYMQILLPLGNSNMTFFHSALYLAC